MKGKLLCGLLISLLVSGCGDSNTPPEKVLKEQFSNQFHGLLTLGDIDIKETSVDGNKRTYSADGSLSSACDLYKRVTQLDDYIVVKKTWDKEKNIKFSATLNTVGNKDTGWKMSFSAMQMSVTPDGNPIRDIDTNSKYIVIGGSGFDSKLDGLKTEFAKKKTKLDELNKEIVKIGTDILTVDAEVEAYWGKDENGKTLSRYYVQRDLNKEIDDFRKNNSPSIFSRKYDAEVFQPAMKERREKLGGYKNSDFDDIREESRQVLDKYKKEYEIKYKEIDDKIKAKMKSLDDGLQVLETKKRGLDQQHYEMKNQIDHLSYEYKNWQRFMEELQQSK